MKTRLRMTMLAGFTAAVILSGCSKKSDDSSNNNNNNSTGSAPSVQVSDGYGTLAAVRSVSYTTVAGYTIPAEVNTAVAAFTASTGSSVFVDGGTVSINSSALTKSSNNAYYYQDLLHPISFSTISWNVSGSSSVPAISYTDDRPVPDYSGFSSLPSAVTRSAGLTVALGSAITNADSVYVVVTDYSGHQIIRHMGGSASQAVFSASDLSGLTAGQGMIQVCPWNYKTEDFSSKKFYFVIESAFTKQGITIN